MAKKDHTLDSKLIESARTEFMEKGYLKASLHTIVRNAGITTGAMYTRYRNKDDLFRSLVQEVFDAAAEKARPIYDGYMEARDSRDPEKMIEVVREEEAVYRDILFEHYEACVLFFAKSDGSSVANELNVMLQKKASDTVSYIKSIAHTDMDLDGITMILSSQFRFYREILEKGWDREKACSAMKAVDLYQEAGWKALFREIIG